MDCDFSTSQSTIRFRGSTRVQRTERMTPKIWNKHGGYQSYVKYSQNNILNITFEIKSPGSEFCQKGGPHYNTAYMQKIYARLFNGYLIIWLSFLSTVCPGSIDPFYIVTYFIKWVTNSWTYGMYNCTLQDRSFF